MDAKERLRQYLEQRREMGERELILDGMNTEEVLRLLGAANLRSGTGTAPPSASAPRPASPPESRAAAPAPEWGATSSDWREALRAAVRVGSPPGLAARVARRGASARVGRDLVRLARGPPRRRRRPPRRPARAARGNGSCP
jgi:DNA polymerase